MNSQIILRVATSIAIIMASAPVNHDTAAISSPTLQPHHVEAKLKSVDCRTNHLSSFRLEDATLVLSFSKVEKLKRRISAKTSGQIG